MKLQKLCDLCRGWFFCLDKLLSLDQIISCFTLNVAATLVKLAILPPMINTFPVGDGEKRRGYIKNVFRTVI